MIDYKSVTDAVNMIINGYAFTKDGENIMVLLNREDIDFNERECIVFGKGSKERIVYFDARTKIHLKNYLKSRTDENPALFVSLKEPHDRLNIGEIEVRLREFGKRLGLQKVHPHKASRNIYRLLLNIVYLHIHHLNHRILRI